MSELEVLLSNCGNIDRDQDPERPVYGTQSGYWAKVQSLEAASRACQEYIEGYGLGGGNWSGGAVRDAATKELVGRISYNGRIWPADDLPTAAPTL